MLHVTNGHSVRLQEAGVPGEVLVWLDALHEGPVPAGLSLEQMSEVRGAFLGDDLRPRDAQLRSALRAGIVLWFEHDLYDQLQLIQLLDFFRSNPPAQLELIQTDRYLGTLPPAALAGLWPQRKPVTQQQLDQGTVAWQAFCAPDPEGLKRLDTPALPYLNGALLRHLDEFPSLADGLGRTDRQILEAVAGGSHDFLEIFLACQRKEDRTYMGDTTLRRHIDQLTQARVPLLTAEGKNWELTPAGRDVLNGAANHIRLNGIDKWLGGVHLKAPGNL